jgi:hypothetical protein
MVRQAHHERAVYYLAALALSLSKGLPLTLSAPC